jgi:hypothetical protein
MTPTNTILDDNNNTYQLPTGLVPRGTDVAVCTDCGRWAYAGDSIRHSTRCDTPTLQAEWVRPQAAPKTHSADLADIRRYAQQGEVGRFTEDEIELAHALGHISTSDAMNRDY